ncbi:MAG: HAMP domain-containing histidine kinase [Ktedonobacterales bacterium]|nr:HAMP domain-containing histidine kinase [Ktedonobacterales bacterium]
MLDQTSLPPGLNTESEIFHFFEEERRLRLVRNAAPLLAILAAAFAASILLFEIFAVDLSARQGHTLLLDAGVIAFAAGCITYAAYLAQRGQGRMAVTITSTSVGVGLFITSLLWIRADGIDALALGFLFLYALHSMLVGLLAGVRVLLLTSISESVIIVLATALAASNHAIEPNILREIDVIIPLIILILWAFTGLTYGMLVNYQGTLRDMSRLYGQVKQIDEIKDQFITAVNHELRNPIMAMSGYIDILRMRQRQMSDDRRAEILDQAAHVGDRISNLLESILDVRRLDQGADDFAPSPVSVRATLEESLQLINPREGNIAERELIIEVAPDLVIWGDEMRLQQVFSNLLSNALKYSPPGTPITVRAEVVAEPITAPRLWPRLLASTGEHHVAEIVVQDQGLGVPTDQIPLLFRRFVRLPRDLASTVVGNGLGLHLCRTFVEAMRGRIWIESNGVPGEGSAFHFTLPLTPTEYALADAPEDDVINAGEAASAGV